MFNLLLANVAAPTMLTLTGNLFIVTSIIPIETLTIWLFCKIHKTPASLPRLLIITLIANLATSIIGIPYGFDLAIQRDGSRFTSFLVSLPIAFVISVLIEGLIYKRMLHNNSYKLWIAVLLSNMLSYIFYIFILYQYTYESPLFSQLTPSQSSREPIKITEGILFNNTSFYDKNKKFSENFLEIKPIARSLYPHSNITFIDKNTLENNFYVWKSIATKDKFILRVIPKQQHLSSLIGVVFVVNKNAQDDNKYIFGICRSSKPGNLELEIPQLEIYPQIGQSPYPSVKCPSGTNDYRGRQ